MSSAVYAATPCPRIAFRITSAFSRASFDEAPSERSFGSRTWFGLGPAHLRSIVASGLKPIALGGDDDTRQFDALDAVGFSCAVPAVIHYDIMRDDPRMHELMQATLRKHEVDYFIDGGISSNVATRIAWEAVQRGKIGTRNALVIGLDCFAPQLRRNMLFLPLQRIAAETVARDRPFAHEIFSYKKVPSPAALVPSPRYVKAAVQNGRGEFEAMGPFLQKMMEPLPPIGSPKNTP